LPFYSPLFLFAVFLARSVFCVQSCLPSCLGYGSSSTRRSFQKIQL
jgi:hypothetical protein